MRRAVAILLAALLAGCGSDGTPEDGSEAPAKSATAPKATAQAQPDAVELAETGNVTPNEDRVATLGLLNKRNNISEDVVLKVGETRRIGSVILKLESCERTVPWESPEEEGAFVQVFVNQRPQRERDEDWKMIFSGWLFKNSPSLNVVEHPVYDVWVKDCAMRFPGEEAKPASAASSSNAKKASGSDSGASASE